MPRKLIIELDLDNEVFTTENPLNNACNIAIALDTWVLRQLTLHYPFVENERGTIFDSNGNAVGKVHGFAWPEK